jgi:GNAT superfamily N-acetyltransferase
MEIRQYQYGSDDYQKSIILRDAILRKPLGMIFTREFLALDRDDLHYGIFINGNIVSTISFKVLNSDKVKMRQVATDLNFQNIGLGSKLLQFCEVELAKLNFKLIEAHARENAIKFYLKNNYKITSNEFYEIGIKHFKVEKVIQLHLVEVINQ